MREKYQAPTVKKAFRILRLISETDQGMRISDISNNLGISKSSVHGITGALEAEGVVMRDPLSKRFTLGFTLFELGRKAYVRTDLQEKARPVMERLMDHARESVFLGVRNGDHVIIVDVVESRRDLKITAPTGTRIPLLAGAIGKIFLSSMTEKQVLEVVMSQGLYPYTPNTITDTRQYLTDIRKTKLDGYATDDEEYIPGVRAVASPISVQNHAAFAIWVVGFKAGMDKEKMQTIARETKKAAETISGLIK